MNDEPTNRTEDDHASAPEDMGEIERAAFHYCERLLKSRAAAATPEAEALVIIAFTFGAAWALDRPDMIELGNAQMDSIRSAHQ